MEFFDKLTKKASETYKGAAEKTGKIAKEAKLKLKISDNKSKINDLYQEIGKKVYQKHTAKEELCIKKDLEEECAKIDILSSEIDTYHKEILNLSDMKVCAECKEPMDKNAKFCPKCGKEQPEVKDVEQEAMEVEVIGNNTENHQDEENSQEEDGKEETKTEVVQENKEEVETEKEGEPKIDGKITYTEGENTFSNTSTSD